MHTLSSFPTGFVFIDKPAGITSHDVVDRIRHLTNERCVGHAGTLDPFATGLLIIGVGRTATKEFSKLVGLDKTYEATILLGVGSDTDDITGKLTSSPENLTISEQTIRDTAKTMIGTTLQIPPAYSAIKVGGKKLYEAAREGKPIEVGSRPVTIHQFEMTSYKHSSIEKSNERIPVIEIKAIISCSSGTYIRAIARDLGKHLGTLGLLSQLRRTTIGPFTIDEADKLPERGDVSITLKRHEAIEVLKRVAQP